jgi:nitroimidazol reductase NimA-like FMN-containing flavoprotein (pyridoxamine 5'-phosphate oxidase superfamily)
MQEQEFIESRVEIENVLREENTGYLGLSMADKPYVVPLNYCYVDGRIIFHCSFSGKKLDVMKANPEVCFTVGRQAGQVREHAGGDPCHVDSDSVICYGRARVLEDMDERKAALNAFNRRFRPGADELAMERVLKCCVVEIRISEMTGRHERERKRTCWRWRPTC